jgi:hypothetical protein
VQFKDKYHSLLETFQYPSKIRKQRLFFPRNFLLSPEFTKAFQKEFNRLKAESGGTGPDILRKINKALLWLID